MEPIPIDRGLTISEMRVKLRQVDSRTHNLERYKKEVFEREMVAAADFCKKLADHVNELTKVVNELSAKVEKLTKDSNEEPVLQATCETDGKELTEHSDRSDLEPTP